jgi:hypothetical protein
VPLLLALPLLLAFVILLVIVLIPISLVQRYRVSTSRQRARPWLIALNIFGLLMSMMIFLVSALITSYWVPDALRYTATGLLVGGVLGLLGLRIARWEFTRGALHYTQSRLLVLMITLVVTARVLYGFWRGYESWRAGLSGESWFVAAGVAGSMAAGAVVLGYYLVFWLGVRRRVGRSY